jgi:uncharacterized protein YjbI with pentapeptide repeats
MTQQYSNHVNPGFPRILAGFFVVLAVALIGVGTALWATRYGEDSTANSDLGLTLLGGGMALTAGGLVGYAVFVAERRFDAALRASDAARERTAVQLALASAPSLEGIDLSGLDLNSLGLHGKQMNRARLTGANLIEADLSSVVLEDAILVGANLSKSNLREANLRNAQLGNAVLSGADLEGADLTRAVLIDATFGQTTLWPDIGVGELVPEAKNLDHAILSGALYTLTTEWPDGFDPRAAGAMRLKDER